VNTTNKYARDILDNVSLFFNLPHRSPQFGHWCQSNTRIRTSSLATGVAAEVQPAGCGVKLKGWASIGACPPMSLSQANATKDANVQTFFVLSHQKTTFQFSLNPFTQLLSVNCSLRSLYLLNVFPFSPAVLNSSDKTSPLGYVSHKYERKPATLNSYNHSQPLLRD
jgi:hypothetical protein